MRQRAAIFVDDGPNTFIPKSAEFKFNDWTKYDREGQKANVRDVKITQEAGLPTRIVVLYTLDE